MKKLRYFFVGVLMVCLAALLFLCGCGGGNSGANRGSSTGGLVMDKKYVRGAFGEYRENYFIFRTDGTGDFVRNIDNEAAPDEHYTMHFKWFYADADESSVVCFYDGIEYHTGNERTNISDDTEYFVGASQYVLCVNNGSSNSYYINEDHVDQLTEYNIT